MFVQCSPLQAIDQKMPQLRKFWCAGEVRETTTWRRPWNENLSTDYRQNFRERQNSLILSVFLLMRVGKCRSEFCLCWTCARDDARIVFSRNTSVNMQDLHRPLF